MKILFKELTLHDFKGLRDYHLDFDDNLTELFADNGEGKTTIVHALFWLFFGKDANGKSQFELFPLDIDNNQIPDTEPTVTLKFIHGAKENIYTRSKKGSKTFCLINDSKVTTTEFKRHVESVVTEELFSALLSPVYFGDNYSWQKQRDTILNNMRFENTVIEEFEYEDVANMILDKGIEPTLKHYDSEKKRLEKSKEQYIGQRDYLANKLEGVDTSLTQEELVRQKELKQQEIKYSEKILDSLHPINKEISELSRQIQTEEGNVKSSIREKESEIKSLKTQKQLHNKSEIRDRESKINTLKRENELEVKSKKREIELSINALKKEKDTYLSEYKKKVTEFKGIKDTCSLCGSPLNEFEIANQRAKLQESIAEIEEKGVTKAKEIENLEAEMMAIKPTELPMDEINLLQQEIDGLSKDTSLPDGVEKLTAELSELQELVVCQEERAKLLSLKEKVVEINESVDFDKIQSLRDELLKAEKAVQSYEYAVKDKLDFDNINKKLKSIMGDYDDVDDIVEAIKQYRTDYAQMIADSLNSRLDRVKIKTFAVQKDGSIKDTFEVSMDGVPYASLNSAGKIEAGIELIQLLSESLNIDFPIVIDNKESITKDFKIPNQLITLSVKKGAKLNV